MRRESSSVNCFFFYQKKLLIFIFLIVCFGVLARKNMEFPILKASSRITARLHYLCPQFFPAPGFWSPQHANDSTNPDSFSKVGKCCPDTTFF